MILQVHPVQFEWRTPTVADENSYPKEFQGRIISMSMFNDIEWLTRQNESKCSENAVEISNVGRHFAHGRWSFLRR